MGKEKVIDVIAEPTPKVRIRVIAEDDSELEKKSKSKYPFKLDNNVDFTVVTNKRTFTFRIHKGYNWNGADIPSCVWVVGSSKDNAFLVPSMVHDYILQFKTYIFKEVLHNVLTVDEYRRLTSLIFRHLLKESGTSTIKANIMAWAVDAFQMTANRGQWNI